MGVGLIQYLSRIAYCVGGYVVDVIWGDVYYHFVGAKVVVCSPRGRLVSCASAYVAKVIISASCMVA